MADQSDSFVREVQEEMRREQLRQIWDRYGLLIIGFVLLVLGGIAGYKYWESQRLASSTAAGALYERASKLATDGQRDAALKDFGDIAKSSPAGYQAIARLRAAGLLAQEGKSAEAVTAYDALAKEAGADPILRDYASLQAAMLRLDSSDWTEMQNRLTPLDVDKSPWRALARETLGLAAFKAGKTEEARKLFEQLISDRSVPQSVSERAFLMMSLLTDAEGTAGAAAKPAAEKPAEAKK
jgi:hypothetical protein